MEAITPVTEQGGSSPMPDSTSPAKFPIRWSDARLASLQTSAAMRTVVAAVPQAKLAAAAGDYALAAAGLKALVERHATTPLPEPNFRQVIFACIIAQDFDLAAFCFGSVIGNGVKFAFRFRKGLRGRISVVEVHMSSENCVMFSFNEHVLQTDRSEYFIGRCLTMAPLFARFRTDFPNETGLVELNVEDIGFGRSLKFCARDPAQFLIPDCSFLERRAYEGTKQAYAAARLPWDERIPVAFWRGSTTGQIEDPALGWRSLPRIRLCQLAGAADGLIDAGISKVVQIKDPAAQQEIQDAGLMRPFVPVTQFHKYKYQIDIDGNTNAWGGLFQKLLTGSTVLKVASPRGYRHWYYDKLKPWVNFVPVQPDMADLVEKLEWLRAHDDEAREIGARSLALALSLDYGGELRRAGPTIAAALRYAGGRPETELLFGQGGNGHAHLRDGWLPPESDGVPAQGAESRIELPRPMAGDTVVLSLVLSPFTGPSAPTAQRVTLVANGEVLKDATIAQRETLQVILPRSILDQAETLSILLLHPDGLRAAAMVRPLDERVLSVTLHALLVSAQ
jgi:hypothetical protein